MKVTLSFTEDDVFIPERGKKFMYQNQEYYIHNYVLVPGNDNYDVYELDLQEKPPIDAGAVELMAVSYATEEVRKLRGSTYLMRTDYSDFEIAKRAYVAGATNK